MEVIGYKGFDKDLKCIDMQYEIGKKYEMKQYPKICGLGYHYCDNIRDVFRYKPSNCRICKVRAYGDIDTDDNRKSCTNKIEILEEIEISKEDRIRYVYANEYEYDDSKLDKLLSEEFILDDYINDEDIDVKKAVAQQGYGLDILIYDESWSVREAVAEQCYGLDKLINDENPYVRIAVVEQGYSLNKLINDKDPDVRAAVAEQGYGLNKLINDKHWHVRGAIFDYIFNHDKELYNDIAQKISEYYNQ